MELSRLARTLGRLDEARRVAADVLAAEPEHAEARRLLERLGPPSAVAVR
jgi:hypothetical protein